MLLKAFMKKAVNESINWPSELYITHIYLCVCIYMYLLWVSITVLLLRSHGAFILTFGVLTLPVVSPFRDSHSCQMNLPPDTHLCPMRCTQALPLGADSQVLICSWDRSSRSLTLISPLTLHRYLNHNKNKLTIYLVQPPTQLVFL